MAETVTEETGTTIDDGGPAFPAEGGYDSGLHPAPGMTLRDWFAGQALGVIDPGKVDEHTIIDLFGPIRTNIRKEEIAAALSYRVADAMLAARKSGGAA